MREIQKQEQGIEKAISTLPTKVLSQVFEKLPKARKILITTFESSTVPLDTKMLAMYLEVLV